MKDPGPSLVPLLVLIPLFLWRIMRRYRRMVGRQRLSKGRLQFTLILYPALLVLLCFGAQMHPELILWLAGGVGVGALLGLFGLRKTLFEPTSEGLFYTPNAHLGIALSALFVGRIVYRLVRVTLVEPPAAQGANDFAHSPLTLLIFGLLAGYYVTYAVGLYRWRLRLIRAKRQREAQNPAAGGTETGEAVK